jgi:hypothetical protein
MTGAIVTFGILAAHIIAGQAGGFALSGGVASSLESLPFPDALTVLGAAAVLSAATVVASLMPAPRARGTRKPTTRWQ